MKEIYKDFYVGNQQDYEVYVKGKIDWQTIQACKEPYHREALNYTGRGAPKEDPEYLLAYRSNRLILNMVDADNYKYIPTELIDESLKFFLNAFKNKAKILVHCNQGASRSPSIAMLCLRLFIDEFKGNSFEEMEAKMRELYPNYNPAKGIKDFMILNWENYTAKDYL